MEDLHEKAEKIINKNPEERYSLGWALSKWKWETIIKELKKEKTTYGLYKIQIRMQERCGLCLIEKREKCPLRSEKNFYNECGLGCIGNRHFKRASSTEKREVAIKSAKEFLKWMKMKTGDNT